MKVYFNAGANWLGSRLFTSKPLFLAHAVTYGCDLRCKMCTNWRMSDRVKDDLDTEEVFDLIQGARRVGMIGYYMWGGEPLLRADLPEILEFAKDNGMITIVNTNATRLEERAEEIGKNLDFAFVSLDAPDGLHDEIRGKSGTFDRLVRGTRRLKGVRGTVTTFVSTISRLNFDRIEPLAEFAKEMGCGISYNAVEATSTDGYTNTTEEPVVEYGLTSNELHAFYVKLLELKDRGYPLSETRGILRDYVDGVPFRCLFPRIFTYVSPDGVVTPCTPSFGIPPVDLRETSFEEYFRGKLFRDYVRGAEFCNKCIRTCVRSYSYTYRMDPFQILI